MLTRAFGTQNADRTKIVGPGSQKMLTVPWFWGRGAKKKLTVARFVAFDVQNADCNKVWRLRRLKTLTVLVFGGVGTQNC